MKQEMICKECEIKTHQLFPNDNPYPGEHVKFKHGQARYDMICDHCGDTIKENDICCAFTIWADYGGIGYFEWENKFIAI